MLLPGDLGRSFAFTRPLLRPRFSISLPTVACRPKFRIETVTGFRTVLATLRALLRIAPVLAFRLRIAAIGPRRALIARIGRMVTCPIALFVTPAVPGGTVIVKPAGIIETRRLAALALQRAEALL